jgi:hypothetical protein
VSVDPGPIHVWMRFDQIIMAHLLDATSAG